MEQPPLPQAPVGGASPVPEDQPQDPNGGEFDDGDDMGDEMPPVGNQGGEGMEQPMGNDMENPEGVQNDSELEELEQIWNTLDLDQKHAVKKYAESQAPSQTDGNGMPPMDADQEPMPPMDGGQAPMQEKVIFKKKQLEELMKRN